MPLAKKFFWRENAKTNASIFREACFCMLFPTSALLVLQLKHKTSETCTMHILASLEIHQKLQVSVSQNLVTLLWPSGGPEFLNRAVKLPDYSTLWECFKLNQCLGKLRSKTFTNGNFAEAN